MRSLPSMGASASPFERGFPGEVPSQHFVSQGRGARVARIGKLLAGNPWSAAPRNLDPLRLRDRCRSQVTFRAPSLIGGGEKSRQSFPVKHGTHLASILQPWTSVKWARRALGDPMDGKPSCPLLFELHAATPGPVERIGDTAPLESPRESETIPFRLKAF